MVVFETERLRIFRAGNSEEHINLFYKLWNNPEVMINVGFPEGLKISKKEISKQLAEAGGDILTARLVVERKQDGALLGECKLGKPDEDGISETDVKLLPEFWGSGYGSEVKRGLVEYLFNNTDCRAVKATPNRINIASQKMQEKIGAKRTGEGVYRFKKDMPMPTVDVEYYEYILTRSAFEERCQSERD